MRKVQVVYRRSEDGWWAESPDVPGWTAVGDSFEEVRDLAQEGLPFFAEEQLIVEEAKLPTQAARINWKVRPALLGVAPDRGAKLAS